ncbi:MAG: glutamyl-tRNA reductase, partial [Bacteroidota bacterium]
MTVDRAFLRPLRRSNLNVQSLPLSVIAFTHKSTPLRELNRFFVPEEKRAERLSRLCRAVGIQEILYLATCNRIEFVFVTDRVRDGLFLDEFFRAFLPDASAEELTFATKYAQVYDGPEALRHLYKVASSLDSLVVGEREIITQVRKAYDACKASGHTGDLIRLAVQSTISTAKRVYTETRIAANPVSVVSLAERQLRRLQLPKEARIIIVGAGETNTNLCKYLVKQGFKDFTVYNRTLSNGQALAAMLNADNAQAVAFPLDRLADHRRGFDVLVTCTGSSETVVTPNVYN